MLNNLSWWTAQEVLKLFYVCKFMRTEIYEGNHVLVSKRNNKKKHKKKLNNKSETTCLWSLYCLQNMVCEITSLLLKSFVFCSSTTNLTHNGRAHIISEGNYKFIETNFIKQISIVKYRINYGIVIIYVRSLKA